MFDKMKQLYDMQKKARDVQKQLEGIKVTKSNRDNTLTATINGAQKVEALMIDTTWLSPDRKNALEKGLCELINEGFADIQKQTAAQAASLMKDLKGLNIPGM